MNLRFCVYPPLRTTTLLLPQTNFVVIVQLSLPLDHPGADRHRLEDYTVSLWSNLRDGRWSTVADLTFVETTRPSSREDDGPSTSTATFRAEVDLRDVPANRSYEFTFRARDSSNPATEWLWAGNGAADNGVLRLLEKKKNPPRRRLSVDNVLEFHYRVLRSPISGSETVVLLEVPNSSETERPIGRLRDPALGRLFLERQSPYWFAPSTKERDASNRDVHLALYRLDDVTFLLLVPFSMDGSSTALARQGSDQLFVRVPANKHSVAHLVATVGSNPYDLIAESVSAVKRVVRGKCAMRVGKNMPSISAYSTTVTKALGAVNRKDRRPESTKFLGWCTWNTFYESVSLDGILSALDGFARSGIHPGWIMIDDGWQHVTANRELIDLEADPVKFPGGLKHALRAIRQRHPSIQMIGVWHTVQGYWNGISHTSPLSKVYSLHKMTTANGGSMYVVAGEDVDRFYSDLYTFLSSAGVGMVKVDNQAVFKTLISSSDRPNPWQQYQTALAKHVETHFKGNVIYCMAHSPDILFNKLLEEQTSETNPDSKEGDVSPKPLLRNSDDYFPDEPASHSWHIYANAVNAYFLANLEWAVPDWDMFQSKHTRAHFHAVARAICGGPVYISDPVDFHDRNLVDRLLTDDVLSDTQPVRRLLCCNHPARVAVDSLFVDPTRTDTPLKLANVNAERWAVVAVFNCRDENELLGILSLDDVSFPLPRRDQDYVVYDFVKSAPRRLSPSPPPRSNESQTTRHHLTVYLPPQGANLFTFAPIDRANGTACGSFGVACFGLIDKYNGSRAILETSLKVSEGPPPCSVEYVVKLKHRGQLGIWLELRSTGRRVDCAPTGLPKAVKSVELNGRELDTSALSYDYDTDVLRVNTLAVVADGMATSATVRLTIALK